MRVGTWRTVVAAVAAAVTIWLPAARPAGAAPGPGSLVSRVSGTSGACGSWWQQTATEFSSGSVCGIDGVVLENGQPVQLAEPLVSVSRYVCSTGRKFNRCSFESYQGTVPRAGMTVDPLLRRATVRGSLGPCALDLEFAGASPPQPRGSAWETHGVAGSPSVAMSGTQTFSAPSSWWGQVCGRLVVAADPGQGQLFRGLEATVNGFSRPEGGGD
jgi:hypothetical protein